ncbi:MAG: DUF6017 domain-containing protein [Oscillospiraceae bacterium]
MNAIFQLLNPSNTISVNRPLAHAIGLNEAIVYGALISKYYWYSEHNMLDDGWFYSTVPDLQESTALTDKQQKRCIETLIKIGLINSELRGMPARRSFYIVDDINLIQSLIDKGEAILRQIKPSATASYEKKRKPASEQNQLEPNEDTKRMNDFLSAAFGVSMPNYNQDEKNINTENPHNEANSPCSAKRAEQAPQNGRNLLRQKGGASSDKTAEQLFIKTKDNKPKEKNPIYPIYQSTSDTTVELEENVNREMIDGVDTQLKREMYLQILKENISYQQLCDENKSDKTSIDEMLLLMLEVICSGKPTIRANGEELPQKQVRSVYLSLNYEHIDYVLTALKKNTSDVRNIRAYLITALYNAPSTMDNYYRSRVNHDMYGGKSK